MFPSSKAICFGAQIRHLSLHRYDPIRLRTLFDCFHSQSLKRRVNPLPLRTKNHVVSRGQIVAANLSAFPSSVAMDGSVLTEGPSCLFVGPVETADKDKLEALYLQARDSYYNGEPLIVDDMFDKVEVRLRWYGSKLVLKYPRCSLKRLSAYADAEVDNSQVLALASIWMTFLAVGVVSALGPFACALSKACEDAVHSFVFLDDSPLASDIGLAANWSLMVSAGLVVGVPVTTAAFGALQGLWKGDLVALKGCCPGCGEEVYAFLRADKTSNPRHKSECHVCERPLVFHANVQKSASKLARPWAYGRIYLVRRAIDLAPSEEM